MSPLLLFLNDLLAKHNKAFAAGRKLPGPMSLGPQATVHLRASGAGPGEQWIYQVREDHVRIYKWYSTTVVGRALCVQELWANLSDLAEIAATNVCQLIPVGNLANHPGIGLRVGDGWTSAISDFGSGLTPAGLSLVDECISNMEDLHGVIP